MNRLVFQRLLRNALLHLLERGKIQRNKIGSLLALPAKRQNLVEYLDDSFHKDSISIQDPIIINQLSKSYLFNLDY